MSEQGGPISGALLDRYFHINLIIVVSDELNYTINRVAKKVDTCFFSNIMKKIRQLFLCEAAMVVVCHLELYHRRNAVVSYCIVTHWAANIMCHDQDYCCGIFGFQNFLWKSDGVHCFDVVASVSHDGDVVC